MDLALSSQSLPRSSRATHPRLQRNACRFCRAPLQHTFVDLGMSPPCQTHVAEADLDRMEAFHPLHAWVCDQCFLVQLPEHLAPAEIFTEYAYFSSYSSSWVDHARRYAEAAIERYRLGPSSRVIEIASNDGYLLQHFVAHGIPVLGIEPAANVAAAALERGIATECRFMGVETARRVVERQGRADLLIGNNVLAHVPDLNDFVEGLRILLAPAGSLTMEFPHLQRLMDGNQFDTIYHEHYSYFSFVTALRVFAAHGLVIHDVEELPTHGGSLRIHARHAEAPGLTVHERVHALVRSEVENGFLSLDRYRGFEDRVKATKRRLLECLIDVKQRGQRIAGYGAPGKGNTLLNYCGIRTDFLDFTVDANPYKQGKFTPGTRIPILSPDAIREARPDYLLILPWNLRDEIVAAVSYIREWGGRFIIPIPEPEVITPPWQQGT